MTPTDRRSSSAPVPGPDRRRGDRRSGQAAVLDHRRATDRRLDAAGAALVLQRRAFRDRVVAPSTTVVDLVQAEVVIDLREAEPRELEAARGEAAPVELVACPLCGVLHDRMWLFAHVAQDHPAGS